MEINYNFKTKDDIQAPTRVEKAAKAFSFVNKLNTKISGQSVHDLLDQGAILREYNKQLETLQTLEKAGFVNNSVIKDFSEELEDIWQSRNAQGFQNTKKEIQNLSALSNKCLEAESEITKHYPKGKVYSCTVIPKKQVLEEVSRIKESEVDTQSKLEQISQLAEQYNQIEKENQNIEKLIHSRIFPESIGQELKSDLIKAFEKRDQTNIDRIIKDLANYAKDIEKYQETEQSIQELIKELPHDYKIAVEDNLAAISLYQKADAEQKQQAVDKLKEIIVNNDFFNNKQVTELIELGYMDHMQSKKGGKGAIVLYKEDSSEKLRANYVVDNTPTGKVIHLYSPPVEIKELGEAKIINQVMYIGTYKVNEPLQVQQREEQNNLLPFLEFMIDKAKGGPLEGTLIS